MVQKSNERNKCRSVVSGKKAKNEMKHTRKGNYKKKVVKKVECCVCMEEIPDTSDNTITCGKVHHMLCGECKMKCEDCPMCRSHKVRKPISQNVILRVVQKNQTEEKKKDKIIIDGLEYNGCDYGNGIYEKIQTDQNDNGIYKNKLIDKYIYFDNQGYWVLNDEYYPDNMYVYAESMKYNKLFGKNKWNIAGEKNWVQITITIKQIK